MFQMYQAFAYYGSSERSYICMLCVNCMLLSLSTIFLLDFELFRQCGIFLLDFELFRQCGIFLLDFELFPTMW